MTSIWRYFKKPWWNLDFSRPLSFLSLYSDLVALLVTPPERAGPMPSDIPPECGQPWAREAGKFDRNNDGMTLMSRCMCWSFMTCYCYYNCFRSSGFRHPLYDIVVWITLLIFIYFVGHTTGFHIATRGSPRIPSTATCDSNSLSLFLRTALPHWHVNIVQDGIGSAEETFAKPGVNAFFFYQTDWSIVVDCLNRFSSEVSYKFNFELLTDIPTYGVPRQHHK